MSSKSPESPNTSAQGRPRQHAIGSQGKPYRCEVCGRESHRKDILSRHMKIHDRVRHPLRSRRKACVQCVKGKIRCSNEYPSCSSCLKRNFDCVYETQPDRLQTQSASDEQAHKIGNLRTESSNTADSRLPSPMDVAQPEISVNIDMADQGLLDSLNDNFLDFFPQQVCLVGAGTENPEPTIDIDWIFQTGDNSWQLPLLGEAQFQQATTLAIPGNAESQQFRPGTSRQAFTEMHDTATKWPHGDLPTPDHGDMSSPEDPWPADIHASSAPRVVFPSFGNGAASQRQKHFFTRSLSDKDWMTLKRCMMLPSEQTAWSAVDANDAPNKETLDYCIDLYFAHMHQMFPIVHLPTFDPSDSPAATLAIASLGALFSELEDRQAFSNSLSELTRRLLLFLSERDRRFVRTEGYLTAQLLQGIHGYCNGDGHLFELSESCRSSMVYQAKSMGLFRHVEYKSSPSDNLEDSWRKWIQQERSRRLGWAIYEYDIAIAFLHNARPHLNIGDANLALPYSMEYWDAPTAFAWAALHPWRNDPPPCKRSQPTMKALLGGAGNMDELIHNERQRLIVVHIIGRMLWSIKDMRSSPIIYLLPDGLENVRSRLLTLLDGLRQYPASLVQTHTRKEVARAVHVTHLIHITHLYGAGDLMTLFFPFLRNVLLCKTAEAGSLTSQLIQWAEGDPARMRGVVYHCAQVISLTRMFRDNLSLEPFHVFFTGILLMVLARLMSVAERNHDPVAALHIDHLGSSDDPISRRISTWVQDGKEGVGIHGVPALSAETGYKRVLEETIELLKNMRVWGISQNLLRVVLRIRNGKWFEDWHELDLTRTLFTQDDSG